MFTDVISLEPTFRDQANFSYSHPDQSRLRRSVIRAVETLTGQPQLRDLYLDWASFGRRAGEPIFGAALRLLSVQLALQEKARLDAVPKTGGVLLVANHPFGVLDGLAIGEIGLRLRPEAHILTNSLLCTVPEAKPHLLPVDFSGTPEARRLTAETRRRAITLLEQGMAVAIFPGGGIATANKPFRGPALESQWHGFAGKLAQVPGTTVLPLYFHGQNSRLFQLASHASYALRLALIFFETRRRMGRPLGVTVGEPIPSSALAGMDREAVAATLRRATLALSGGAVADPDDWFRWPAHVKF